MQTRVEKLLRDDRPNSETRPSRQVRFVYLGYFDDSVTQDKKYQIVGGVLLEDKGFNSLEACLSGAIEDLIPEAHRESFEFHGSELAAAVNKFKDVLSESPREKTMELLSSVVTTVCGLQMPVFYGAVDVDSLAKTHWGNVPPLTVCFRVCLNLVEQWFQKNAPYGLGLIVFDQTEDKSLRAQLQKAYRDYRKPVRSRRGYRGLSDHLHDDLYFGESLYSFGLQAADVCTYIINHHLCGRADTENLFEMLRPNLRGEITPRPEDRPASTPEP